MREDQGGHRGVRDGLTRLEGLVRYEDREVRVAGVAGVARVARVVRVARVARAARVASVARVGWEEGSFLPCGWRCRTKSAVVLAGRARCFGQGAECSRVYL